MDILKCKTGGESYFLPAEPMTAHIIRNVPFFSPDHGGNGAACKGYGYCYGGAADLPFGGGYRPDAPFEADHRFDRQPVFKPVCRRRETAERYA